MSLTYAVPTPIARIRRRTLTVALPVSLASALVLLALPDGPRAVATPMLVMANVSVWFVVTLWNRDRALPVFELGPILVAVTVLYAAYPLFAFLMSGSAWTLASDNRLRHWHPDAETLGTFAWGQAGYLISFVAAYLLVRGRAFVRSDSMRSLSRSATLVVLWLFLVLTTYFAVLSVIYGVTYDPSYRDVRSGLVGVPRDLPHVLQQFSHNLKGILVILKLCLIAVLVNRWRSPGWRTLLLSWLGIELVATGLGMGARTEAVTLLMAAGLLYHRLVHPLNARVVVVACGGLVAVVLLYGFSRDFASTRVGVGTTASYWSAANEFQILLGTAYDLHMRQLTGELGPVPWQVYASDALLLIPGQLLPVSKIDPADWYLGVLGYEGRWLGLMFGVTAQAVIGYGWIELVARGAVLGALFALIHRWYVRRARSFWASLLYLYICVWSYYTFRASSFYFLYFILYRFLPTMFLVRVGSGLVRRMAVRAERERSLAGKLA